MHLPETLASRPLWSVTYLRVITYGIGLSPLGSTQAATSPLAIVHGQSNKEPARVLRPAGRHQQLWCVCVLCVVSLFHSSLTRVT